MRRIDLVAPRGAILRALAPETQRERMRGLLGRPSLGRDQALLLESTRSVHTLGMGFPIRVALLDHDHVIQRILHVPPIGSCGLGVGSATSSSMRRGPTSGRETGSGSSRPTEGPAERAAILPGAAPGPGAGCGMDRAPIV